ncbi:substrate-binding domain-containing protein [Corynebacterium sp. TA-R-1]|uniref:Substrate-binding domain-containing protein n=1 Tax=Corynebacterium stercoris TaxID=2943490 RepID=A0ABT1G2A9_9CORY|nr:substrate-binding domain-containing protein [Corynebacterium stercoris]MCP1388165.1 substrate-binding domain-containing protein [Corynebacterium stercoris]
MKRVLTALPLAAALLLAGCSSSDTTAAGDGAITITGSATVEPITRFIAERTDTPVNLTSEGSTDGFQAFCKGESDINDSSVAIPAEDQKLCEDNKVEFIELPIALDAITLVKNNQNTWAQDLTIDQLREIWSENSGATRWSDLDPSWPDEEITLYGRPDGSGTLGVFKNTVLGDAEIRSDYAATDDIDELSSWIADDVNGLGFMGIGNYLATEGTIRDRIDNVSVDGVAPGREETQSGEYPLARPLFIYVSKKSAEDEKVETFVTEYLNRVEAALPRVFFYQLPEEDYADAKERFEKRTVGADAKWQG